MPTSAVVHEELTDILVRVLDCPADAVVPEARLKDLGSDSLTVVEIGEELGRRFKLYLSDDTIDELVTVRDAIRAVVHHDGTALPVARPARPTPPSPANGVPSPAPLTAPKPTRDSIEHQWRGGRILSAVILLGLVGAALGGAFGLAGAALVGSSGIGAVDLPPLVMPTTPATTPTPPPHPSPAPTTGTAKPKPTLETAKGRVAPGERFALTGVFPSLGNGATLQVQVRDKGGPWDDFPIQTTTRDGGTYRTEIYTSRTGAREFRMLHKKSGKATPAVTVEIG